MARCQWGKVLLVVGLAVWSSALLFTQDAHAAGPPIIQVTANPNPIAPSGYGGITLRVLNGPVTDCDFLDGPWGTWLEPADWNKPSITFGTNVYITEAWRIQCFNTEGNHIDNVLWVVDPRIPLPPPLPPVAPTLTLNAVAGDITITLGDTVTIVWDSPTANDCTASSTDGSWSGPVVPSGTANVTPGSLPQTYSVFCSNAGGKSPTTSRTVTAVPPPVAPPAPILTLNGVAGDIAIILGSSVTIDWDSPTATGCTASGTGWSGPRGKSGTETVIPALLPKTYELKCTNAGGDSLVTKRTASELPPATPVINKAGFLLPAEPVTALPGDRTVVYNDTYSYLWETTNADKVVWNCVGDWTGSDLGAPANQPRTDANSSTLVGPAGGVVTCTYTPYKGAVAGASVTRVLTITAVPVPAPVITLQVIPGSIPSGGSATLSWAVTNATGCDASSTDTLWAGPKNFVSGSDTVSPVTDTSYTLTCWNATDTVSKTVTLIVVSATCNNFIPEPGELCDNPSGNGSCPNPCSMTCTLNNCIVPPNPTTNCSDPKAICRASCFSDEIEMEACGSPSGHCCKVPDAPSVPNTIEITNPIAFTTVQQVLGNLLGWLQAIVAILALVCLVIGGILYMTAGGDDGRLRTAKGAITVAIVGFALGVAAPSFLKQIGDILGWGAVPGPATGRPLAEIAMSALNFLLSITGVIAVIMLVVGGIMYLTSAGDEDRMKTGRKIVVFSIVGIGIALAALVIVGQLAVFFN